MPQITTPGRVAGLTGKRLSCLAVGSGTSPVCAYLCADFFEATGLSQASSALIGLPCAIFRVSS